MEKKNNATAFYIGTQTMSKKGKVSEGIYQSFIDDTGKLSKVKLVAKAKNPSYLTKTMDNKYLISRSDGGKIGLISYKINKDTLIQISTSETGQAPCFVSSQNNFVLNANYRDGTVNLHTIDETGTLSNLLATQKHHFTTIPVHPRQSKPHAHSSYFEPNSNNVISIDLGANKIIFSTLDTLQNTLELNKFNEIEMPKNSGPRLLTFHPKLPIFYVVNELNATVSVIEKNILNNSYSIKETLPTLPKDYHQNNSAAHIEISKDGQFLYMSNRGHDSIVVFKVSQTGSLNFVERISVHGKHPRNFSLTKDNTYMIVANRDTDNLCSFKRNSKTGKLTFVDEVKAPKATCILF